MNHISYTKSARGEHKSAPPGKFPWRRLSTSKSAEEVNGEIGADNGRNNLSASTISDNDEFPAKFSHVDRK